MVRLKFILDGRETVLGQDGSINPVDKVMLLAVRNHIQRRLDNVSCPRHGQPPSIIASGPSPDRLTFSVEGCCENLTARAMRALDGTNEDAEASETVSRE